MNELQQIEIANQIAQGNTSGILFEDDGTRLNWSLSTNLIEAE